MNAARSAAGPGPKGTAEERFPREMRIGRTRTIRSLLRRGARKKTPHLDVFVSSSSSPQSRWGIIVPKHRRTIVERNRVKRRLREIGRRDVLPRLREEGLALDVLVRARSEAYAAGFGALKAELQALTEDLCSRE